MQVRFIYSLILCATLVWSVALPGAEPLKVGQRLPVTEFTDQHDRTHSLGRDLKYLVFSADMKGGSIIHEWMIGKDESVLRERGIAFLADIHRMPGIITRLFALPKMKKYSYPLLLIRDDRTGQVFPRKEDAVTILTLKNLTIQNVSHATSAGELQAILR